METLVKLNEVKYGPTPNYDKLLGTDWAGVLKEELLDTIYMKNLMAFLRLRYQSKGVWPKKEDLFENFRITPFGSIRLVIIGDEPYNDFRATGIPLGNKSDFGSVFSPALRTWTKGIEREFYDGFRMYSDSSMRDLAKQGVMLLDVASTSDSTLPNSYKMHWRMSPTGDINVNRPNSTNHLTKQTKAA